MREENNCLCLSNDRFAFCIQPTYVAFLYGRKKDAVIGRNMTATGENKRSDSIIFKNCHGRIISYRVNCSFIARNR